MEPVTTKPYLVRAIHEWCSDQGYTPYLAVRVSPAARVPVEYVKDGQIVLNVSHSATHGLLMDNVWIRFSARFNGASRAIEVPVDDVVAIYARETGEGMSFVPGEENGSAGSDANEPPPEPPSGPTAPTRPKLQVVK